MTCPVCQETGYRFVAVPVFADGGYTDVDYFYLPCACNPAPTDADAANWLDDPDFIIEGESVLYVPKGWPDDFGHPGETPDCPFDPTPPDHPNYLYGTE